MMLYGSAERYTASGKRKTRPIFIAVFALWDLNDSSYAQSSASSWTNMDQAKKGNRIWEAIDLTRTQEYSA